MSDRATTTASLTFESLYGTHHGWLKSWLTRKLQSAFDADDIAQDTFLRVMVSETLSTIRDPRSFLCTIAKRVMVDLFRRNALEKAYLEMLALMPEGGAPSPEERESQLETLQLLDSMLDGLNGKTREAFLLSQLDGLTYSEIAHKLGVSISSVKKYVAKARRALPAVPSGVWVMNPLLTDSRRQALRSASHWYAVLSGERVSPQQEARWQQWYEQDQDNQWAWQQVENLRNQLGGVPGDVASPGVARYPPHPPSRDERITAVARRWRRLAALAVGNRRRSAGRLPAPPKAQSAVSNWKMAPCSR